MTSDIDDIAARIPIEKVLEHYHVKLGKRTNGKLFYYCPWHDDVQNPNLCVTPHVNKFICFACGLGGGVIKLISYLELGTKTASNLRGEEFVKVLRKMEELAGEFPVQRKPYKRPEMAVTWNDVIKFSRSLSVAGIRYLWLRGISNPWRYYIGETSINGIQYVTIPVVHNSNLVNIISRRNDLLNLSGNRYYNTLGGVTKYPVNFCSPNDTKTFFFEDTFSALSVRELGFPSVSLASGARIVKDGHPHFYAAFKNKFVLVIPQNDEAGQGICQSMEELQPIDYCVFNLPEKYKDMNEFIQRDKNKAYHFLCNVYRD